MLIKFQQFQLGKYSIVFGGEYFYTLFLKIIDGIAYIHRTVSTFADN